MASSRIKLWSRHAGTLFESSLLTGHLMLMSSSHIICLQCSKQLQITNGGQQSACPVCNTNFTNPDDAIIAILNPTEDYKTSVLSGLSPNVIMECAGRALSFWAYQTTQEMFVSCPALNRNNLTPLQILPRIHSQDLN